MSIAVESCDAELPFPFSGSRLARLQGALFLSILRVVYRRMVRSAFDGQVAVLGLPGALVRQENRAFGERPRAGKAETRGHGPFTEESLAGAEK